MFHAKYQVVNKKTIIVEFKYHWPFSMES